MKRLELVDASFKHQSFELAAIELGMKLESLVQEYTEIRFDHDFEFWAYSCVKIQDKQSKKEIPFLLSAITVWTITTLWIDEVCFLC